MKAHNLFASSAIAGLCLTICSPSHGQTASLPKGSGGADVPGDIIVTAQRKSERLSEVPISVQAVGPSRMRDLNIRDLQQVQLVTPGLTFNSTFSIAQPFIRGVGANVPTPGLEPPVATYVDEFYSPRSFLGVLDLVDVSNVQILRGPQGTLYGRNATGGALLISTTDPQRDLGASIEGRYGRFDERRLDGILNVPLSNTLAVRLAGRYSARDGYITNPTNDEKWNGYKNWQVRGKARWDAANNLSIIGTWEYAKTRNFLSANQRSVDGPACFGCLVVPTAGQPLGFYETIQGFRTPTIGYQSTAQIRANLDLDSVDIASISGYRKVRIQTATDQGGTGGINGITPLISSIDLGGRDYSQEIRASSKRDGPLNLMLGASYTRNSDFILFNLDGLVIPGGSAAPMINNVPPSTTTSATYNKVITKAWSIYGEIYYDLSEHVKFTVGGRYNEDRKSIAGFIPLPLTLPLAAIAGTPFDGSVKFTKLTPRVILAYNGPAGNYYVSYNQAFKSGGFDTPSFALGSPVKPEKIDSIEVGAKNSFAGGRLKTRLAAFYYFYKGIQVAVVDPQTTVSAKQNAAGANVYGAELDLDWAASDRMSVSAGANFLHATYKGYGSASIVVVDPLFGTSAAHPTYLAPGFANASGTDLPYAPSFTSYISTTYNVPLSGGLNGKVTGIVRYSDGFLFTPLAGGALGLDRQGSYTVVNMTAEIGAHDGNWAVGVYADNLTGTKYLGNSGGSRFAFNHAAAPPATYGMSFRVKY